MKKQITITFFLVAAKILSLVGSSSMGGQVYPLKDALLSAGDTLSHLKIR